MKKYFILIISAMMLQACGGNKAQSNANEEAAADAVAETEATAAAESVTSENTRDLLWGFATIDNDLLEVVEDVDREEFYMAQEFLMEVVYPNENVDTYSEEWITAHCSAELKQFLRDEYDYDGEGYAKWLLEGRFAGEAEYDTEVTGFGYGLRNGKRVYSVEKRHAFEGIESFVRTLYFSLDRKDENFVITSFELNMESKDPTVQQINQN